MGVLGVECSMLEYWSHPRIGDSTHARTFEARRTRHTTLRTFIDGAVLRAIRAQAERALTRIPDTNMRAPR